jgi:hypothetical protein
MKIVEKLSLFKCPDFSAVTQRFSMKKKFKRKTHFFPRFFVFPFLTQRLMGKMGFFQNSIFITSYHIKIPPWIHSIAKQSFYRNHLYFLKGDVYLKVFNEIICHKFSYLELHRAGVFNTNAERLRTYENYKYYFWAWTAGPNVFQAQF